MKQHFTFTEEKWTEGNLKTIAFDLVITFLKMKVKGFSATGNHICGQTFLVSLSSYFSRSLLCFGHFARGVIRALVLWVMKLLAGSLVTVIAAVAPGMWWGVDMWGSCEGWRVCMLSDTHTHTHLAPCWARRSPNLPLMMTVEQGWPWFCIHSHTHTHTHTRSHTHDLMCAQAKVHT